MLYQVMAKLKNKIIHINPNSKKMSFYFSLFKRGSYFEFSVAVLEQAM